MKIGDVVQLNAGGPLMSVNCVDDGALCNEALGVVDCEWFNIDDECLEGEFYVCQLVPKNHA